jgi:predicted secreted protein
MSAAMTTSPRRWLVAVAAALGLITAGLTVAPTAQATTVPSYTLSASGRTVSVKAGHEIRLDLRTDVHDGYGWVITTHPAKAEVALVSRHVVAYAHAKGAVGFPYHTYYLLKAVGHGSTTIKLAERKTTNTSTVARRFTLGLRVPATVHACTRTSSGTCIQGGEFCPQAKYGQSGWDAQGRRYVCKGSTVHPHWEIP